MSSPRLHLGAYRLLGDTATQGQAYYRALSNAGLWCVGRLQTDADRERVVDGLGDTGPDATMTKSDVSNVIKKLAPRWFLLRDAHAREGMMLLQPRWAMTLMLGPMTRTEIKRARELAEGRAEAQQDQETSQNDVQERCEAVANASRPP